MKRDRNVKIVATLGPASNDYDMIRALHEAGADVFRLNMSHGDHSEIAARHAIIRQVEKDLHSPIAILADLQGPKLRVGTFEKGEEDLQNGAAFRLDLQDLPGDINRVTLPHPEIFQALEPGARLLVNDGKIRLKVQSCGSDFAECVVEAGGVISNRKGAVLGPVWGHVAVVFHNAARASHGHFTAGQDNDVREPLADARVILRVSL